MENGTLAALFWLWAIFGEGGLGTGEAPRMAAVPGITWGLAQTYVDRAGNGIEARATWLTDRRHGRLQPVFEVSITEKGGAYLGAGFRQEARLAGGFWLSGQFTGGIWRQGADADLGLPLEFRTGVALEWETGQGRLALGWDHRSNGELGRINPGMEALSLRYTWRF